MWRDRDPEIPTPRKGQWGSPRGKDLSLVLVPGGVPNPHKYIGKACPRPSSYIGLDPSKAQRMSLRVEPLLHRPAITGPNLDISRVVGRWHVQRQSPLVPLMFSFPRARI